MAKIDEVRERINYLKGFLTILIGIIVLIIGGLVNLYSKSLFTVVFWLGVILVFALSLAYLIIMKHIESYLKQLGDL